jgi:adenylate cyclase
MISEFTLAYLTPGRFRTRVLDVVKVMGKLKAVKVYDVYGETSDPVDLKDEAYYRNYQDAFEAYLSRDFETAGRKFKEALSLRTDDPAAKDMIQRIASIEADHLTPDWDGSITLTDK